MFCDMNFHMGDRKISTVEFITYDLTIAEICDACRHDVRSKALHTPQHMYLATPKVTVKPKSQTQFQRFQSWLAK